MIVVLLHAGIADHRMWDGVVPALHEGALPPLFCGSFLFYHEAPQKKISSAFQRLFSMIC